MKRILSLIFLTCINLIPIIAHDNYDRMLCVKAYNQMIKRNGCKPKPKECKPKTFSNLCVKHKLKVGGNATICGDLPVII